MDDRYRPSWDSSGWQSQPRSPATFGVTEGIRTPDIQDHNLAL